MQLIQYAPTTDEVYKRPLLYVPPLVNKYYLLDLQPKSSPDPLAGRAGAHLFVISWVNPGPELADKGLDDYLDLGPAAALDAIEKATGEKRGRPVRLLHGRHARRDAPPRRAASPAASPR